MTSTMDAFTFSADDDLDTLVAAYRTHGVVVVRRGLPDSVVDDVRRLLVGKLDAMAALAAALGIRQPLVDAGPAIQALLKDGSAALATEQRHQLIGHFPLEVRLSETLRQIPAALADLSFLKAIHGSRALFAHMPINARWILPNQTYAAVPAHQDASYNTHIKDFSVIWTPLCEIDADCGGMAVYPGSGVNGLQPLEPSETARDWLPAVKASAPNVPLQPLSPGDIVVFDETTVHESMPNLSDRIRLNVEVRMFGNPASTTKHYLNVSTGEVVAPAVT